MKGYKFKEIDKILRKNNFVPKKQNATSHIKYLRDKEQVVVTRPNINMMIWERLCKQFNINI